MTLRYKLTKFFFNYSAFITNMNKQLTKPVQLYLILCPKEQISIFNLTEMSFYQSLPP